MIDLYTWTTPNGYKVSIALEELGLAYRALPVNIGRGEQFEPSFLAISPNNRIPAIVDHDGGSPGRAGEAPLALFESGAILIYLAEKAGRLLPEALAARYTALQWLMFQMGGVGPMLGQAHHFRNYAPEKIPYAVDRYTNEAKRLYGVLDRRLGEAEFLAGEYSIADIATYPWLRAPDRQGVAIDEFPNVGRWRAAIEARPAVARGLAVPPAAPPAPMDDEAREALFGNSQYTRR
jgi:GST-like protein